MGRAIEAGYGPFSRLTVVRTLPEGTAFPMGAPL